MPIVHLHIRAGRSPATKAAAIARMTDVLVETLDVAPAQVRVLIHEVPDGHWGVGGVALGHGLAP
jgi:4-oxalocrotonate tautomerase